MKKILLLSPCLLCSLLPNLSVGAEPALRELRLSPQVRSQPLPRAEAAIPFAAVHAFLDRKRILEREDLEGAPYLVANREGRMLSAPGDLIFARGAWRAGVETYDILRQGPDYLHPESGALLGVQAAVVGQASLLGREGDRARLQVEHSDRELRQGDRLLPRAVGLIDANYLPAAPTFPLEGQVLDIAEGLAYGGRLDSLVLDLGAEQGLAVGHLLSLRKPDQRVTDPLAGDSLNFPGETFGSVLVYRVFDRLSLALVLNSSGPIRRHDTVVTPYSLVTP